MEKYIDILETTPLFAGIKREELLKILVCLKARVASYKKNETIFFAGDIAEYVGIVLLGDVQIVKEDYYGNRSIVARVSQGQLFAEAFACAFLKELPVSVVAGSDCSVLLIDCKHIIKTCANSCEFHNQLINNLLYTVAAKNIILNQKIELTSKRTTKDRLMAYLLSEAKKAGRADFTIPYDRQQLADYLCVERCAMSVELGKLKKEGLIDFKKSNFRILKKQELEDQ